MKPIIIFDFNRTIYDPESNCLLPGTELVLSILLKRGFILYLISRAAESRKELIEKLNISKYFKNIIVTPQKSKDDFNNILGKEDVIRERSFVVGDRVREEIKIGNQLGLNTVWLQRGKFASEFPQNLDEQPTYIIKELKDFLEVVF